MKCELRHARPLEEKLPDGRRRCTFQYKVREWVGRTQAEITASVWLTAGSAGPGDFSDLRLLQQILKGDEPNKDGSLPLLRIYEEIPATAEVQIGGATTGNTMIALEDGRTAIVAEFLQLAAGTYVPGTVDTTTAPGDASAFLQKAEMTHDGTLRRIKRTYVYAGQLSQTDETKHNGALLVRTLVYVKTVPSTPAGYTLITARADPVNGIPVYTYTFAQGTGEISRDIDWSQGAAPNAETLGVTKTTIRYLVGPTISVQPTSLAGSVEISRSVVEQDGYRIWTTVWAKGAGLVITTDELSNGGKLVKYRRVALGSAPSAPASTIAGTVTSIGTGYREEAGFKVYDYTWAEGVGEISRSDGFSQSSDQGTSGVYRVTIRKIVAAGGTVSPAVLAGYTSNGFSYVDQDGYRIWTTEWVKGTGEISRAYTNAQGGPVDFNPAAPTSSIGPVRCTIRHLTASTVTTDPTTRPTSFVRLSIDHEERDGYRIWTVEFGYGAGLVLDTVQRKHNDKLRIYHKVALGTAPTIPSGADTLGSTVMLLDSGAKKDNGYTVYDYTWAEGIGIISERTQSREGGLLLFNRDFLTPPGTTDITTWTPAAGILVNKEYNDLDGYRRFSATWMQKSDGTSPTTGTAVATEAWTPFTYPGRAKTFSVAFTAGGYTSHRAREVYLSPPVQGLVLATTTITYQTGATVGALANTLWNPTEWATLRARWIAWVNSPRSKVEGLRGYRVAGHSVTGDAVSNLFTSGGGTIPHGMANTDQVYFSSVTGGGGAIAINTIYYLRAIGTAYTFELAATSGGAQIDIGTNVTAAEMHLVGGLSGGSGFDTSVMGDRVYASTDWRIDLIGGPANPGGSTWTLAAAVDPSPAFIGYDGTKYYRLVVVTATPAAQAALPI